MSTLLDRPPYGPRDEARFLEEANQLSRHHLERCPEYARIWKKWQGAGKVEELPYLHVGLFKHIHFKTNLEGVRHERILKSSATTSGVPSLIHLDTRSSELQAKSSTSILKEILGEKPRPLVILDSAKSLLPKGEVSARVAAAMSLRPLSTDIYFLLEDSESPDRAKWESLRCVLENHDQFLVYGFTHMLWQAWSENRIPQEIRTLLSQKQIHFVHSGGWKKLEALKVRPAEFDATLRQLAGPGSQVLDFYGLVEQVGIIYPLCPSGYRHVPNWADVVVRDPFTLQPLQGEGGLLQLINTLAWGAPYHSVLTEDLGRIVPGPCGCGRSGKKFELLGRIPKAEARGCSNV